MNLTTQERINILSSRLTDLSLGRFVSLNALKEMRDEIDALREEQIANSFNEHIRALDAERARKK